MNWVGVSLCGQEYLELSLLVLHQTQGNSNLNKVIERKKGSVCGFKLKRGFLIFKKTNIDTVLLFASHGSSSGSVVDRVPDAEICGARPGDLEIIPHTTALRLATTAHSSSLHSRITNSTHDSRYRRWQTFRPPIWFSTEIWIENMPSCAHYLQAEILNRIIFFISLGSILKKQLMQFTKQM